MGLNQAIPAKVTYRIKTAVNHQDVNGSRGGTLILLQPKKSAIIRYEMGSKKGRRKNCAHSMRTTLGRIRRPRWNKAGLGANGCINHWIGARRCHLVFVLDPLEAMAPDYSADVLPRISSSYCFLCLCPSQLTNEGFLEKAVSGSQGLYKRSLSFLEPKAGSFYIKDKGCPLNTQMKSV